MTTEFAHQTKQARSQTTQERVVRAFVELLEEQTFDSLSVTDVTRRAEVSVGAFYKRFPSKEALLLHSDATRLAPHIDALATRFAADRWDGAGLDELARAYIDATVDVLLGHPGLVRAVALYLRGVDNQDYRSRARRRNQRVYARIRDLVLDCGEVIPHPDPAAAFDFVNRMVTAAAREATLYAERPVTRTSRRRREALVDQLTHAFLTYLRNPLP
ncbi:MAG: TetR/AcrR family transcriptional regulator [Planctomycetota bacterium]